MCIPQVLEPFSTWNTMNNVVQIKTGRNSNNKPICQLIADLNLINALKVMCRLVKVST